MQVSRLPLILIIVYFFYPSALYPQNIGTLKVKVNTNGANIYINNSLKRSNVNAGNEELFDLPPGKYNLKATKPGSFDEIREIVIKQDEVTKVEINFRPVSEIDLKGTETGTIVQGFGKLTIRSNPPGATVYVGGRRYNIRTPDTFSKIPTGSVLVKVELDGRSAEKLVTIEKDRTNVVEFDLTPQYGTLTVHSDPPGASVNINGKYEDTAPLSKKLLVGEYRLKASKTGWQDDEINVKIEKGRTTIVSINLKKLIEGNQVLPEDIGRSYKQEIPLSELGKQLKEEYYYKESRNYKAGLPVTIISAAGFVTSIIALSNLEGRKTDERGNTIQEPSPDSQVYAALLGTSLSLTGLIAGGAFMSKRTDKISIPQNIEYNNQQREAFDRFNKEIRDYNKQTEEILKLRREKIIEQNIAFNKNRETTYTIK